jgi:glycosyltransferase involved in cell wall biosynthesis
MGSFAECRAGKDAVLEAERIEPRNENRLRVVAMAPGEPYDPRTNSGVSRQLFTSLAAQMELAGTVSCQPSQLAQNLIRLRSFAPTKSAWRSRWRLSMHQVRSARRVAERGLVALPDGKYDAFFQLGTYCGVTGVVRKPIFAYLDHDLMSMVRLDPRMSRTPLGAGYVRRRIDDEKRVLDATARIFTYSDWCGDRIAAHYDVPRARIETVGAGSNIDERLLAREPDYEARHVVFIGFDFDRKGGRHVLSAFARLRSQLPGARLTFVGGAPQRTMGANVRAIGAILGPSGPARIADILASASLYVMPSIFEPFGIAFLEAMAAGLPCIGSDRCAMPEIIGDTGAVVDVGDAEGLARAMYDFLSDPAACRERGRAARARYRERYGWEKVASRIRVAMERTLGEGPAAQPS